MRTHPKEKLWVKNIGKLGQLREQEKGRSRDSAKKTQVNIHIKERDVKSQQQKKSKQRNYRKKTEEEEKEKKTKQSKIYFSKFIYLSFIYYIIFFPP